MLSVVKIVNASKGWYERGATPQGREKLTDETVAIAARSEPAGQE
jgi:hypothetical protein